MRSLTMPFLLGAFGCLSGNISALAQDADTRIAAMPYADCLGIIAETSREIGETPVRLISNGDETTVRIKASDGFVTVSCQRNDNKMVLTKSSVPEAAGLTASR